MKRAIFLFIGFLVSVNGYAENRLLSQCMTLASSLNKNLPFRVNSETVATSIGCKQVDDRVINFYNYKMGSNKSEYTPISDMRNSKLNYVCSKPSMRELVYSVDIEYIYYDSSNSYMGSVLIQNKDCNRYSKYK